MLNFFRDEIIIPGISNLEDAAGRPCKLILGSNVMFLSAVKSYFYVNFRMSVLGEDVRPISLPQNELGIGLSLDEAKVFCEALYNLAKQNSRTEDRVEIEFSGDNSTRVLGAPLSYAKSTKAGSRRVRLQITIEPVISTEGVAKVTLQTLAEDKFFCSAVLSGQDALILSYISSLQLRGCIPPIGSDFAIEPAER
jgi:hypothetical protein